jgi:acyl carrier protein
MNSEVELKVKQAIGKVAKVTEEQIRLDALLLDLSIDSFAGIDLMYTLEDAFNVKLPDNEVRNLKTVKDVIEAVQKRLNT